MRNCSRRHRFAQVSIALLAGALISPVGASAKPVQDVGLEFAGRTINPGSANQTEIAAYDPETKRVFATNATTTSVDIYDFSDPTAPGAAIDSISLSGFGGGVNSVAVSGGVVAVAVEGATPQDDGTIRFFDAQGAPLGSARAGALPDMVTFTKDGRYVLSANEGEPATDGLRDPEGSVTIVDTKRGFDDLVVREAGFRGVRLRGRVRAFTPGSTVAQDLEPEYISTSGETAYVSIQEANAIGILDIREGEFDAVRSLGFKDWSQSSLDTSNGDDGSGAVLREWDNLRGMYQPDAIGSYQVSVKTKSGRKRERTFVATANEGDARDYDFFSEEQEVADLSLDPTAFPTGTADAANLGELKVTDTMGDTDGDGDFDQLFAFGGRSLSILDSKGGLSHDTGGELEFLSSTLDLANFNKNNTGGSPDNRSDDKGPEPEALAIGRLGGRPYAFLGAERSGGLYAYDLGATPGEARFANAYLNTREADLGPEGALFIPKAESPIDSALVLFTYEVSSTIAAYEVSVAP